MRHAAPLALTLSVSCASLPPLPERPMLELVPTGTTSSLRGLCAIDASTAWATGSGGTCVLTVDGGRTWRRLVLPGADELDLRDVEALDGRVAWVMAAGPGDASKIFHTRDGGATWELQYVEREPDGFLDGLAFWDARRGVAYGDPVGGTFRVLRTEDGGGTWAPVGALPPARDGEVGFAASGTGITTALDRFAWFCTGGAETSRVFRTTDAGVTWSVADTPVLAGTGSAGGFSLTFLDHERGALVGGDYQKPEASGGNAAVTTDGGRTWQRTSGAAPGGHRACVAHYGDDTVIATGRAGGDVSRDAGRSWSPWTDEAFYCVSVGRDGAIFWAGADGRAARLVSGR